MSADEIFDYLYKPRAERNENHPHIALKGVHINKSPAISPANTLTPELAERWGIDWQRIEENKQKLVSDSTLIRRLEKMYNRCREIGKRDADSNLYLITTLPKPGLRAFQGKAVFVKQHKKSGG